MFQLFRTPKFEFMKYRGYAYLVSGAILLASLAFLGWHWQKTGDFMEMGIDFKGGTIMQVRFAQSPDVEQLRAKLSAAGFSSASIQRYGDAKDNSILVRLSEQLEGNADLVAKIRAALRPEADAAKEAQGLLDLNTVGEADLAAMLELAATGTNEKSPDPIYNQVSLAILKARGQTGDGLFKDLGAARSVPDITEAMKSALDQKTYAGSIAFLRTESVGPAVGKDLRSKAFFASLVANGLILIYLWFRFELRFGVAAVICLIHDVIFIVGVFAITGREFDLTVLAAILTVIGYSVNDTIVVFDRIRENLKLMKKAPLVEILNTSINQTLARTLLTSSATLFVVIALYFYGGPVLNSFAFALLIGILEGTYSSIFVASPLLLAWERFVARTPAKVAVAGAKG